MKHSENRKARRHTLCFCVFVSLYSIYLMGAARNFRAYNDVRQFLPLLELSVQPDAWPDWVAKHDRDIRSRLLGGDLDTIVNWLLFGTSFTKQPRALFEVHATSRGFPQVIARRIRDMISALRSADSGERSVFARRVLLSQGYGFDTAPQRTKLEEHLQAEIERVLAERQEYALREDAFPAGDFAAQMMAQSRLFRDRGLSLDTSILSCFAIDRALETMRDDRLLSANGVRRVAVIGPGLDFADKNSGYDFYPVQTLQPFATIDSLLRLGLSPPADIEVTTLDISPRVNDHILTIQDRGKTGKPYVLRLPADQGSQWTTALVDYRKSIGNRIGSEVRLPAPRETARGLDVREVEVRPQVAARVAPVDFNIVTEKWTGPPFDLVIATNVLVYYDKLDQSLAFAGIEEMLRPGGFFLTNNAIVELPVSHLRSVGFATVRHALDKVDHVFWYRRNER